MLIKPRMPHNIHKVPGIIRLDKMKELDLNPRKWPPLELLFSATAIQERRFETILIDADIDDISNVRLAKIAGSFDPAVVIVETAGFDRWICPPLTSWHALDLLRKVKEKLPYTSTVLAGPHPTSTPKLFLDKCDYLVRGDYAGALPDLVDAIAKKDKISKIEGVCFRRGQVWRIVPPARVLNLDSLPLLNYSLLPMRKYVFHGHERHNPMNGLTFTPFYTLKGCPFSCTFCYRDMLGSIPRYMTVKRVIEQMKHATAFGIQAVFFYDETFTIDMSRTKRMCEEFTRAGIDFVWGIQTRADKLDVQLVRLLKTAGCRVVELGLETADDNGLLKINKREELNTVENTLRFCKENGLYTKIFFMLGNEKETLDILLKNLIWIVHNKPDGLGIGITTPYPGTKLYDRLQKEFGTKTSDDWYECYEFLKKMHCDSISKRLMKASFVQAFHEYTRYGDKNSLRLVNSLYFLRYPQDYIRLHNKLKSYNLLKR